MDTTPTPTHLPLMRPADIPGIGGVYKQHHTDFVVEEIPLYEASGEGDHWYATVTREGQTTQALAKDMQRALGIGSADVGYAGQKDKHAVTTQTFSFYAPKHNESDIQKMLDAMDVTDISISRHANKLKLGHLIGNRFTLIMREVSDNALDTVNTIAAHLQRTGIANYFGEQRFGAKGDNAATGRDLLLKLSDPNAKRVPRKHAWKNRLMLSALQSELFNAYAATRITDGLFNQVIEGDVCRIRGRGALFHCEDITAEQPRCDAQEIDVTGPIYGYKTKEPLHESLTREDAILTTHDIDRAWLRSAKITGSRRPIRIPLSDFSAKSLEDNAIELQFSLPKGSYATTVLREFM